MPALYNRIAVATDFSDNARHALDAAAALARKNDARIDVIHILATGHTLALHADHEDTASKDLDEFLSKAGVDDVLDQRIIMKASSADQGLLREANRLNADLIAIGTQGRTGLSYAFLGSVASRIVQNARVPVMSVREQSDLSSIERVLCAVDLSDISDRCVDEATALANVYGAEVVVGHVIAPSPSTSIYGMPSPLGVQYEEQLREAAQESLGALVKRATDAGAKARGEVDVGLPSVTITDMAKRLDADVIVMATRGLTGLDHVLLGSTAERVVRTSPVPVISVK